MVVVLFLFQVNAVLWCSVNGLSTTIKTESHNFKTAGLLIHNFVCVHMYLSSTNAMSLETEDSLFCVVVFNYEHYFLCTTGYTCM